MSDLPPSLFAREARSLIEQHTWDSMSAFTSLHRDGQALWHGTWFAIDPTIDPAEYPDLIIGAAHRIVLADRDDPPVAFTLQVEAYVVPEPGPRAPAAERAAYDADCRNRTFHQRPDAQEKAAAWCTDIHGRLWLAEKTRGREEITEHYWPSGANDIVGGPLVAALWAAGVATGALVYGLPVKFRGREFDVESWFRDHGYATPPGDP